MIDTIILLGGVAGADVGTLSATAILSGNIDTTTRAVIDTVIV